MSTPPPLQSPQNTAYNPACRTCGQGMLTRLKMFRLSGPAVVIGFVLLVPSILGMLFGLLMLIGTGAAGSKFSSDKENDARTLMAAQRIPDTIIDKVVTNKTNVSDSELLALTPQQKATVREAGVSFTAGQVGTGVATAFLGGFSIVIIFMSFVGGLTGWLLVMRKTVLKCSRCGVVLPAS